VALLGEHEYRPAPGRAGDGDLAAAADRTLDPGPWRNRDTVEMATLEWVDWYNNRRLFEALGDIPPAEAESAYYATMTPSESPRMAEQTLH
jgi:transposase InsO family protein